MRDPSFWWSRRGFLARLLQPLSFVYGAIAARRMRKPGLRVSIPVICVGNFTLGGAGKTPAALSIVRFLAEAGENPFFLTRGYGGSIAGPVRVDPAVHGADDVGDEPLLLARSAATVVSHDRVAGAKFAQDEGASVIVMDDGLQNPSLEKDLCIAVIDARRGIGNGLVFPAGPLRAPLRTQVAAVNAILYVGDGRKIPDAIAGISIPGKRPLLRARLEPDATVLKGFGRKKVLAFAGIGDPEKFFMTLAGAGVEAIIERSFPDHYRYTASDAAELLAACDEKNLIPVTTEKDLVRLSVKEPDLSRLFARAQALPVILVFEDQKSVKALLKNTLAGRAKNA